MTRARAWAVAVAAAVACAAAAAGAAPAPGAPAARGERPVDPESRTRMLTIHYRAHNGTRRAAYVLLPAWYRRGTNPPIPLIISPHGRGLTGRQNAAVWGNLPGEGDFAVINPNGHGRRLALHSWGYAGQIRDLARMPQILQSALPWVRIEPTQIYAFGGSMGGQEALLLAARYPRLLAGVAAFSAVTDFAHQYGRFPSLTCHARCLRALGEPLGTYLQRLAREEVGGTPATAPGAYLGRSPLRHARRLAFSCVPIQLWWSVADKIVRDQNRQSLRLVAAIRRLNPYADLYTFAGSWIHTAEMSPRTHLPRALWTFGLLPPALGPPPPRLHQTEPQPRPHDCRPGY